MERDFNYVKLVSDNPTWEGLLALLQTVKSAPLKACAMAFHSNMLRSAHFAALPTELLFQASRNTRLTANAIFRSLGIGSMTLWEQIRLVPTPEMKLEFAKEAGEAERTSQEIVNQMKGDAATRMVPEFLKGVPEMRDSMDALLTSIVLESWLFFEALAGDLWVAAVDNSASKIRARFVAHREWEKGEMLASSLGSETECNPATHPAAFKREIGQVAFQRLRSIRDYYAAVFGNEIKPVIDDTAGGYIYALSAVRNCITHSAGKRDAHFDKSIGSRNFDEFKDLKRGERLLLDGPFVKKLRNVALEVGGALLLKVDAMLQNGD